LKPLVSILIPVVRPEKAKRCIETLRSIFDAEIGYGWPNKIEIIAEPDVDRIGCPRMLSQLVEQAQGDLICFLGDDTIPEPGWLDYALETMKTLPDGWGLVGLNTENSVPFAHWIADRRMLDLLPDRQFFNHAYQHNFCDRELYDIAVENGRWAWCEDSRIKHDHPVTGSEADEFNRFASERFQADQKTYWRRKRERLGFKLGIGFPLVDRMVHVSFFTSFACMDKPEAYNLYYPTMPHGPWGGTIAEARNDLVLQALEDGCSHLLMLDTDQTYPPETLNRMLDHDVDVCGVRVHRRYPPFDPIMYRGEMGRYQRISDDEMFSGELVRVDATGTGCLLFRMDVFDRVERPWFQLGVHPEDKPYGEDIYFCDKARRAGIDICVDTSLTVGHLTWHEVGRGDYELFQLIEKGRAHHGQEGRQGL